MTPKQALEFIVAVLNAVPLPLLRADWLKLEQAIAALTKLVADE